jgi:hypothetical protein
MNICANLVRNLPMSGSKQLCFRAGPELSEWLRKEADEQGLTVSAMIKSLLMEARRQSRTEKNTVDQVTRALETLMETDVIGRSFDSIGKAVDKRSFPSKMRPATPSIKRTFDQLHSDRKLTSSYSDNLEKASHKPRLREIRHKIQSPALDLSEFERGRLAVQVFSRPAQESITRRALSTLLRHEGELPEEREVWMHNFDDMDFVSIVSREGIQAVFRYRRAGAMRRLSRPPQAVAAAASLIDVGSV